MIHKHYMLNIEICAIDAETIIKEIDDFRRHNTGFSIKITRDDGLESNAEFTEAIKSLMYNIFKACYQIRKREMN